MSITYYEAALISLNRTWASVRSGFTVLRRRLAVCFISRLATIPREMTWWSFLQLPTIYLKLVVLFGAFQMTTHLWLSIVTNGGTLKINGATRHKAWQLIASIESRWYGQTHASFALHWVPASVVTTMARRKMSAAMVISGKFLWGSRSAVSLGPGSAVGEKGKKRSETAKNKNNT